MNSTSYQKFVKHFGKFLEEYNKELLEKVNATITLKDDQKTQLSEMLTSMSSKAELMGTAKAAPKKKRAPTAYNLFMKDMIKELRQKYPDIDKKDLMSMGAKEWQKQKAKLEKSSKK